MKTIAKPALVALLFPAAALLASARASAQTQTTVTISQPPATGTLGSTFSITETVWNSGTSPRSGGPQTLSLVPVGGGATITLGTRSIPGLQGGALSSATTAVTIPGNTPAGTYVIGVGNAGCASGCLKSTGTMVITASSAAPLVTVTVYVIGPGTVSGGRESDPFQGLYFQNCSQAGAPGCVTSGPAGSAFVLTARPGTVPGTPPFGRSRPATFAGWQGCTGTPQGPHGLRIVANTSITCTAKFQ